MPDNAVKLNAAFVASGPNVVTFVYPDNTPAKSSGKFCPMINLSLYYEFNRPLLNLIALSTAIGSKLTVHDTLFNPVSIAD